MSGAALNENNQPMMLPNGKEGVSLDLTWSLKSTRPDFCHDEGHRDWLHVGQHTVQLSDL